jgi:peptidyl-prolyl cis-trans isomerase SurA
MRRLTLISAVLCLAASALALPALAADPQPFAPAVIVNGHPITNYQIAQRRGFLELLHAQGDLDKLAEKQLIDDALQLDAAKQAGITPSPDEIKAGMSEFAGRAKMTSEQFVAELAKAGIDPQTFTGFVTAGVAWRALVHARVAPFVSVNKAEVHRAQETTAQEPDAKILLSELVLPMTPELADQSAALAEQLSHQIRNHADFAAAARRYSASPSGPRGGNIEWLPLANLPPEVAQILVKLAPGQVSPPIRLPNAIALFEVRALQDGRRLPASQVSVKYAQYLIAGVGTPQAQAEAAQIRARVDTCTDLYGIAKGQPAGRLTMSEQTMAQVPADIGLQLAQLDPGESSTALHRGGDTVFLMLCHRRPATDEPPSEDDVSKAVFDAHLSTAADNYLAELRADAFIRRP